MKNLEEREMSKLSQEANIKVKEINDVRKKIVSLETEKIENEKMIVNSSNSLADLELQIDKIKQDIDLASKQLESKESE